jgi:hypothetical protein
VLLLLLLWLLWEAAVETVAAMRLEVSPMKLLKEDRRKVVPVPVPVAVEEEVVVAMLGFPLDAARVSSGVVVVECCARREDLHMISFTRAAALDNNYGRRWLGLLVSSRLVSSRLVSC